MPYAFEFNAYNKNQDEADEDGYKTLQKDSVTVIVKADDEQDAEASAKALVVREVFRLREVTELSEDYMAIKDN